MDPFSFPLTKFCIRPFPLDRDYEPVYTVRDLINVLEASRIFGASMSSIVALQLDKNELLKTLELRQISLLTPAYYGKFPDPKDDSEFNTKELRDSIVVLSAEPEIFENYTVDTKV